MLFVLKKVSAEVMLEPLFIVRAELPLAENAAVPVKVMLPPVVSDCPSKASTVPVAIEILPVRVVVPLKVTVPLLMVVAPVTVTVLLKLTVPEVARLTVSVAKL